MLVDHAALAEGLADLTPPEQNSHRVAGLTTVAPLLVAQQLAKIGDVAVERGLVQGECAWPNGRARTQLLQL